MKKKFARDGVFKEKMSSSVRSRKYIFWSLTFSYVFVELGLSFLVAGNPAPVRHAPAMMIYYLILSLVGLFIVNHTSIFRACLIFFVYGLVVEFFIFRNIKGWLDIPGILFFGGIYTLMFGLPIPLSRIPKSKPI